MGNGTGKQVGISGGGLEQTRYGLALWCGVGGIGAWWWFEEEGIEIGEWERCCCKAVRGDVELRQV